MNSTVDTDRRQSYSRVQLERLCVVTVCNEISSEQFLLNGIFRLLHFILSYLKHICAMLLNKRKLDMGMS